MNVTQVLLATIGQSTSGCLQKGCGLTAGHTLCPVCHRHRHRHRHMLHTNNIGYLELDKNIVTSVRTLTHSNEAAVLTAT